jgi:hypothetical protein
MKLKPDTLQTDTERAFASAIALGSPITTAATHAGLSIGSAANYLKRPAVASHLRALHAHMSRVLARLDAGPTRRQPRKVA